MMFVLDFSHHKRKRKEEKGERGRMRERGSKRERESMTACNSWLKVTCSIKCPSPCSSVSPTLHVPLSFEQGSTLWGLPFILFTLLTPLKSSFSRTLL